MRKAFKVGKARGWRLKLARVALNFISAAFPVRASDGGASARLADAKPVGLAVEVEPTPDWVRERTIPEATDARTRRAQSGAAYLLVDEQYRTRADGHDGWYRSSSKVTNRSGLEGTGQITVTYDPSFESVGVNFIHIIRDGKVIDLTRETKFRVVEHEGELDDGIISGTLKAIANLRDVRVGDILDYATTVHTRTSLWPGHAFYHFSQRYSEPLAMRSLRFVWPAGIAPQYKSINSDIAFEARKTANGTEWEWIAQDPPAMQGEDDVPDTAFEWGLVDVSTMKDWAELARWASGLYQGDESLPDDFSARLDAIAKAYPAPGDRLTEASRYVQDNIRYVGEELGEGSYVPRRPRLVLTRGYGDCKDKSLLLAVALRRLGIDAVPALVSTRAGERLPDRLPSPLEFDHVIVRAVIDGKLIWIDPTGTHRGGRGAAIVPSDLGYALPIRAGQTALERMEGFADHAGRMTVLEQFTVDEAGAVPLTLHVETRYTDARADYIRARWAATSAKSLADSNLEFYRKRFPGLVESKPLELSDDRNGNLLTMVENYTMSREAFSKAKIPAKLITNAYTLQNVLPDRQASPRVQPLALPDYLVSEQTIELRVKDRMLDGLDDIDAKGGPIAFSRKTSKLPDGLRIVYRLDTGAKEAVPASEAEAIYALSDKIKDELGIEFYLEKSPRSSSMPAGVDAATWSSIKSDMEKVVALTQKNDQSARLEALALLSAMSGKVAHPSPAAGLIEGIKGALLSELRRPQAALVALQSATAQFDGNPEVFHLWIGYELDLGTGESVAKAMQRTLKAQPKVLAELDRDWVSGAWQTARALAPEKRETVQDDICLALAESGWQQDPRTSYGDHILGCAIAAHSHRGEIAAARMGLAKDPPTDALLSLAIDRRHQALWPELDRLGSDGFRRSLDREAARAAAAVKAAPNDYEAVSRQMQALRALGRFQEALAAGKTLASDKAQIEVVGHDAFWLVNEYAGNLHALGRVDEAIAALDGVVALGIDRYPELASIAINRAETVHAAGRYQAALDSYAEIEAQHFDKLNSYGKMWVWAGKACALTALGRDDEAKAMQAKLASKPEDNWNAATAAAACRSDIKAIADMLVIRLRDSDARPGALGLFIQFGAPEARTPVENAMRDAVAKARAMPQVQAEFAKYGRAIRYAGTTQGWSEF
jgi:transglutaminase-like putative cysteine protease/tetratricopeptide (TPR) repeat protein